MATKEFHSSEDQKEFDRIRELEEKVRLRIKQVLKENRLSINKICGDCMPKRNQVTRQLSGASITFTTLLTIHESIPNVSVKWILTGDGEPYIEDEHNDEEDRLISIMDRLQILESKLNNL